MRRERSPPGLDLPGSGALSHPASAPGCSGTSRPAPLPRLGTVMSLQSPPYPGCERCASRDL